MRPLLLSCIIMLAIPMSTLTAQESVAIINYHKSSTVGIIYRVSGQYRPDLANAIDEVMEKYHGMDREKFIAVAYQESSFDPTLIHNGDFGAFQIHLSYWRDKYQINEINIMDVRVNTHVAADIWLNYAKQDYSKYNGTKRNMGLYNKKLKEVRG